MFLHAFGFIGKLQVKYKANNRTKTIPQATTIVIIVFFDLKKLGASRTVVVSFSCGGNPCDLLTEVDRTRCIFLCFFFVCFFFFKRAARFNEAGVAEERFGKARFGKGGVTEARFDETRFDETRFDELRFNETRFDELGVAEERLLVFLLGLILF
jgi:hypothetical protein